MSKIRTIVVFNEQVTSKCSFQGWQEMLNRCDYGVLFITIRYDCS